MSVAVLIDIEGIDGSGKGTQARLLCDRLTREGISHRLISFPRYDTTFFGRVIGEFLNGKFGTLEEVDPFLASLLFAGDRYESRDVLREALQSSSVIVLDRYVPSNIAHQAAKRDGTERRELIGRILHLEYEIYQLPRPEAVLLLDLPVKVAQELVSRKAARSYTDQTADIQEADSNYLGKVRDVYQELAHTEPNWRVVPCTDGQGLRVMEAIGDEIWNVVQMQLAKKG